MKTLNSDLRDYIRKYPASIPVLASLSLSGMDLNTLAVEKFHEVVKSSYQIVTDMSVRKRADYPDGDFGTEMFTDYAVAYLMGRHFIDKLNTAV
ncbi:hypothetical protein V9Q34_004540, partial [Salmonella enterica subsp. enterica serovar Chester]